MTPRRVPPRRSRDGTHGDEPTTCTANKDFRFHLDKGISARERVSVPSNTGQARVAASAPARAKLGQRAEDAVAVYLERAGFRVVARNLRLGRLELDIVAESADVVAVVEVRTRGSGAWTTGLGSLSRAKRDRIRRAGQRLWRDRYKDHPNVSRMRFDAASVRFNGGEADIDYVVAAF